MKKKIYNPCTGTSKLVPQRTCVACRQVKVKNELVRLARNSEGEIQIDNKGKMDGRGAYLCPAPECLERALHGIQIEHVLKCRINPDNRERLIKSGQELLKELSGKNQ